MDELLEVSVSSITDQLVVLYPDGSAEGKNNEAIKRELEALLAETYLSKTEQSAMRKAIPISIQRWKKMTPVLSSKTLKPKSISLFDQLMGGGFQHPVTIDDMKEAQTAEERLAVFHRVSYLDDLLLDWNEIKLLLFNELQDSLQSNTAQEVLKIHRKYYDLGRASTEYLVLQHGICQNIFDALFAYCQQDDVDAESLFLLIRTWNDILVDLLQRDVYTEDLVSNMESRMLQLLLDDSKHHSASSTNGIRLSTAQLLALVDSHAKWFQGWVRRTSMGNLLKLVEKTSILPIILWRCDNRTESGDDSTAIQSALWNQSLVILASIVEKTRISCFPFHLASSFFCDVDHSNEAEKFENEAHIDKMIGIFLQSTEIGESFTVHVCCSALEDILSGCSGIRDSSKLIGEFDERVSSMSVIAQSTWETTKSRVLY